MSDCFSSIGRVVACLQMKVSETAKYAFRLVIDALVLGLFATDITACKTLRRRTQIRTRNTNTSAATTA